MLTLPVLWKVATPLALTVAISGSEVDQVTFLFSRFHGLRMASHSMKVFFSTFVFLAVT